MESGNGTLARIGALSERTDRIDDEVKDQDKRIGTLEVAEGVLVQRVNDVEGDVSELTQAMRWLTRGAWAAAATFLVLAGTIGAAVISSGGTP